MGTSLRGGKTAPRILQDLDHYHPLQIPFDGHNILIDVPFHDASTEADENTNPALKTKQCHHQWCLKNLQCDLPPPEDFVASAGSSYAVASFCAKCRCHLDVGLQYDNDPVNVVPCPQTNRPLHHFIHKPEDSRSYKADRPGGIPGTEPSWTDVQQFECSASECGAHLSIRFRPPRLIAEWVSLLTDSYIVKSRAEKAIASDPAKFEGHAVPNPGTVLENLSKLVRRAIQPEDIKKPYSRSGRNWPLNFGDPCNDLMRYLGFTLQGNDWAWPIISETSTPQDEPLCLLDDVQREISVLMSHRPDTERRMAKFSFAPELAIDTLRHILACDKYKRISNLDAVDLTIDEHPCYAGLGALADFHDDLIVFAYERQIATDYTNIPFYLECLQTLANGRESEELVLKATLEESDGRVSLRDIRLAYQHLGMDIRTSGLNDDVIIGSFQARLSDSPKQEGELRRDLKIIGQHRRSPKIAGIASQAVTNYEQALAYLDAAEETSDEFITSMFTLKVDGRPSEEATARQAVAFIANHRKSRALKQWLDTGMLGDIEMDIGQAYIRLDITDRTLSDEMVLVTYKFHAEEQPSQAEDLNRALFAIAKSRDSEVLLTELGLDNDAAKHAPNDWPIGLDNIGNTCYLNSLLQFYFAIKPLRDMLLEIEQHKTDTDERSLSVKRVGSRIVSRKEVDRALKTADELSKLFKGLIVTPKSSFRPDTEVARLTLLTPKAEIARRQSLLSAERPDLATNADAQNGSAIESSVAPLLTKSCNPNHDVPMQDGNMSEAINTVDSSNEILNSSSTETLVEVGSDGPDLMLVDTSAQADSQKPITPSENTSSTDFLDLTRDKEMQSIETKVSIENDAEAGREVHIERSASQERDLNIIPFVSPIKKNPPIPPRPRNQADEALKEAEFGAQQQDVGEINGNVLFQLECAIRADDIDASGEQIDQIKRLFFGKQKSYITDKKGAVRTKEEFISDVKVNVAAGPRDIYAALDEAFDVQEVEIGHGTEPQYSTISTLPPVLQIHIQRAQFDFVAKKGYKSENHLAFTEVIFMDRYLDSQDPELLQRRQESWAWKKSLNKLEKRYAQLVAADLNMAMPTVLESAHDYLQQLKALQGEYAVQVPPALPETLLDLAAIARTELDDLSSQIRDLRASIQTQFSDLRKIPYRLAAVFMHRGTSNAGHYWIYIYDFETTLWRKYNDEKVTQVRDTTEIFGANTEQRPPTPYFLVYVRDDEKDRLVQPLCRDVKEQPIADEPDEVMPDYIDIPILDQHTESSQTNESAIPTASLTKRQIPMTDGAWEGGEGQINGHW